MKRETSEKENDFSKFCGHFKHYDLCRRKGQRKQKII